MYMGPASSISQLTELNNEELASLLTKRPGSRTVTNKDRKFRKPNSRLNIK